MRKLLLTLFLLTLLLILFTFAIITPAQSGTGRLTGVVAGTDGLVPGVAVTLTDGKTGRVYSTTTNDRGAYNFEHIPPGVYQLKVTADGFKSYVAKGIKIDTNRTYSLNPELEIGDVAVEVVVQAGSELINSANAELSTTVTPQQVLSLPLNGRNPLALLSLQAGVNPTAGNHINGQRTSSTNFTRDGINVQDNLIRTGAFVPDQPTVDDIDEFTVTTQNAGAELGNGASAQVNFITPRGESEFHGALFIYNRNARFAANTFGNNATKTAKPFLNRNQLGGKVSGPIVRDKIFFFASYERFLLRQTSARNARILLNQYRDGTFNYTDLAGVERTVNVLTGKGFRFPIPPAAQLPVDPTITARVLTEMPKQGNGVIQSGGLTQELAQNIRNNRTRDTLQTRVDADLNDKNNIYGVFRIVDETNDRPDVNFGFDKAPFAHTTATTKFLLGGWNTIIGSNFTNEFRAALNYSNPFFHEATKLPKDFIIGGLPFGLTNPQPTFQRQSRDTKQYTIQNNSTYSFGNHVMRFGFDYNSQDITATTNSNRIPEWRIANRSNRRVPRIPPILFPGGISGVDRNRANSLRALLGGIVGRGSVTAPYQSGKGPVIGTERVRNLKYQTYGFYVSDQWRMRPDLTLTLGLRWDYFTPVENPDQVYLEPDLKGAETLNSMREALLDPDGRYVLLGNNAEKAGRFFKPDLNNFAPSFGVAWTPDFEKGPFAWLFGEGGKTVIRGSFRLGYINDEHIRSVDNAAGVNPGLNFTRTLRHLDARFDDLPELELPEFTPPPYTFARQNRLDGNFFNTVFAIDPKLQMQRNMQYSFGIQREIGDNTAIEFRYVGSRSNNMVRGFDFNQLRITNQNPDASLLKIFLTARNNCRIVKRAAKEFLDQGCTPFGYAGGQGLPGQVDLLFTPIFSLASIPAVRLLINEGTPADLGLFVVLIGRNPPGAASLLANNNAGVVDLITNGGKYRYDALQAEFRRRLSDGLRLQANYTFSKVLSDVPNDSQARFNPYLDFNNQGLEYSRADYDRTHTVNINATYELPFGQGKRFLNQGGAVDKILGGFELNGIVNISSGVPFSIKDINGTLNRRGRSNRQTANSSLTQSQIREQIGIFHKKGIVYFINPDFISPEGSATNGNVEAVPDRRFPNQVFFRVQPGETGTLQRSFLNGPWYFNVNMGLLKTIKFGERYKLQFRAEAFNFLNRTNFDIDENSNIFNVDSDTFGQIPLSSTYAPRIMQFALRFEF
jgi:hypothetical protein